MRRNNIEKQEKKAFIDCNIYFNWISGKLWGNVYIFVKILLL